MANYRAAQQRYLVSDAGHAVAARWRARNPLAQELRAIRLNASRRKSW